MPTGRRSASTGLAFLEKAASAGSVLFDSSMKRGKARKVAASSWLRAAVVEKTLFELTIQSASWSSRSVSASKTTPVSRMKVLTARSWELSTVNSWLVVWAKSGSVPKAALMSWP